MSDPAAIQDILLHLRRRFGSAVRVGRSRIYRFGLEFSASINYSKLLGNKYFFGLSQEVLATDFTPPDTRSGNFVLLVCGEVDKVLVLPRQFILEMMQGVKTRRVDIFVEDGVYVLQTTKHPKQDVTRFLNAYPREDNVKRQDEQDEDEVVDRLHTKIQWGLIRLGMAEGCAVWVPNADRSLSYKQQAFSKVTLGRLPNFGFDETTRRIVQNIDVLWLRQNIITKAFEVESTTTIYSGLLRLNDLVLAQPNNSIDLHIVSQASRRAKVQNQLHRPSFRALIPKCGFVSFDQVETRMEQLDTLSLDGEVRVSGLIRGEKFPLPEHYIYPSSPL